MKKPLFAAGSGDVLGVTVAPPANRSTVAKLHSTRDAAARKKALKNVPATYGKASLAENAHTLVYKQTVEHPRLAKGERTLEVFRRTPRARLTVRFERLGANIPELFYVGFTLPLEGALPRVSNGGMPFTPYTDQVPGSCADYYAIDSWAEYSGADGQWLWVTRDAPMIAVGGPHPVLKRTTRPEDSHRLFAMVFDNFWHTNFVADEHGAFEFQFDLAWRGAAGPAADLAAAMLVEPVVVVNPAMPESVELETYLFRP
jgi:hypothetical protein